MSDTEKNLNMVVTREAWSDGDYRQDMRRDVDQLLIHMAAARWMPGCYEGITAFIVDSDGAILEQRHVTLHVDDSGVIAETGTMTARINRIQELGRGVTSSEVFKGVVEHIRQEDQEVHERNADTVQRLRELLKPPPSVDPVDKRGA